MLDARGESLRRQSARPEKSGHLLHPGGATDETLLRMVRARAMQIVTTIARPRALLEAQLTNDNGRFTKYASEDKRFPFSDARGA